VVVERWNRRPVEAFLNAVAQPIAMSSRAKQAVVALLGFVLVGFGVHYALFGSLPVGKPALLEDDPE
jgi:hypothetical protein